MLRGILFLTTRVIDTEQLPTTRDILKANMEILLAHFLFILSASGLWVIYRWQRMSKVIRSIPTYPDAAPKVYQDLESCKRIIAGLDLLDSSMHPLESRSGPNQRLVRVFGIDNAFTTTKEEYWKEFRKSVERQMRISEERWEGLAHTAQELVHRGVGARTSDERDGILLVPFMQTAVLKFSLHVFFPVRVDELEDEVLSTIADKINRLWIGSKGSKHTDSMRSDQRVLMAALRKILPGYGETMRTNPLNIIMPAYETMWRVVLRGFLEVGFRSGHRGQIWRQVMDEFLLNPSRATFDTITPGVYGVSPAFIVDETLRLYPPTRRIYRHKQDGVDDTPDVVAADIEHLHRDPDIWGQDSMLFRPSRWASLSEDRRSAFIPFGAGHFTCPAKRDAGPRMVGILMAALLGVFDMGWECEAINPEDEIDGNDPLNSGRDSYTTLRIRRVVP